MTVVTRQDIMAAKARYDAHRGAHHCRTGDGCKERIRLWLAYQAMGECWGREYRPARNFERRAA